MKYAVAMLSVVLLWPVQGWAQGQPAEPAAAPRAARPESDQPAARPEAARQTPGVADEKKNEKDEKEAQSGQAGPAGQAASPGGAGVADRGVAKSSDKPAARPDEPARPAARWNGKRPGHDARLKRMRGRRFGLRLRRARMWSRRHPFAMRRGPFSIVFTGQLQVQGVLYVGKDALYENGDPASDEGIRLRRARLGVFGDLPWSFHYVLNMEAVSDLQRGSEGDGLAGQFVGAQLLDAAISWRRWPALEIGAGARKVPGARGRMVSSRSLQLVERSIAIETLVIDRRPGFWVKGDLRWFKYDLGFFNADKGLNFGNEGGGYMSAARLEAAPLGPMGSSVSDMLKPFQRLYHKFRFGAGVSFQYAHGPATDRMTASADLGLKWHGLSFLAEAVYNWEKPQEKPTVPSALSEVTEGLGAYGQVGYFILPGQLEVAVRFEYLDPNLKIDSAWDVWAVTGGVNYLWTKYLRAQLSYTHKEEVHNAQLENDALLVQMQAAF